MNKMWFQYEHTSRGQPFVQDFLQFRFEEIYSKSFQQRDVGWKY